MAYHATLHGVKYFMFKTKYVWINALLRLQHNDRHFAEGISKFIFIYDVWKWLCFYLNYIQVYFYVSNWPNFIIGLSNGLAPYRRNVITCTNDDPVNWRIWISFCNCYYIIRDIDDQLQQCLLLSESFNTITDIHRHIANMCLCNQHCT